MVNHRTARINGLSVFYREAGTPGAPKLLLLGGFPASSHQFRNLIPALADRFHIVSPDYPGFGNTDMPDPTAFAYTFDHLSEVVEGLLETIGFTGPMGIYMQDYGGPVGNRIITRIRSGSSGRSSRTRMPMRRASPRRGTPSATRCGSTGRRRRRRHSCRSSRPTA